MNCTNQTVREQGLLLGVVFVLSHVGCFFPFHLVSLPVPAWYPRAKVASSTCFLTAHFGEVPLAPLEASLHYKTVGQVLCLLLILFYLNSMQLSVQLCLLTRCCEIKLLYN